MNEQTRIAPRSIRHHRSDHGGSRKVFSPAPFHPEILVPFREILLDPSVDEPPVCGSRIRPARIPIRQ